MDMVAEKKDVKLKVAALALNILPGEVDENLRRATRMLEALPEDTDVAVLPELFTTAFMKDSEALMACAEFRDGKTMRLIAELSRRFDMMIAGSYLVKECCGEGEHRYYNRGFMVMPDGSQVNYDKHHLFCLSEESRVFTHGRHHPPVVNFRGWNISMLICYELRFPVWCRNVDNRAHLILVPANWPQARGYAWTHLVKARAIENQVVMVAADHSGEDDFGVYDGLTMIVDELGRQVAPQSEHLPKWCPPPTLQGEEIATEYGPIEVATLSMAKLENLRHYLPVTRDADSFELKNKGNNIELDPIGIFNKTRN